MPGRSSTDPSRRRPLRSPSRRSSGSTRSKGSRSTIPGSLPYIYLHPIYAPHTEGKLTGKPFLKTRMHLVERLANHLMKGGKFTGKKSKALATIRKAFDELAKKEEKNPLQLLVDAVENAAPREEVTRLQFGGISVPRAVDASPARRLNVAIRNIALGRDPGLAQVHETDPLLPRGRDPPRREGGPDLVRRRSEGRGRTGRPIGAVGTGGSIR